MSSRAGVNACGRKPTSWKPGAIASVARRLPVLAAVCVLAISGCLGGDEANVPAASDGDKLRGALSTYRMAQRNLGRPPENMSELEAVLTGVAEDPKALLSSARDGEPFVIAWGVNINAEPGDTVMVYERTGVNGRRMVVTIQGVTKEVSAEEFANLKFPEGHEPKT